MKQSITIELTPEELAATIDQAVEKALDSRLPRENDLLLPEEVAAYFRVTVQTILEWRKRRWLVGVVIGTEIRFERSELKEAPIRSRKIGITLKRTA